MQANAAQLSAITSNQETILAVAGPGSGKTATLIKRIERLLADGVPASQMVIITFTNAAAAEVLTRLTNNGTKPAFGYIGTLHGFMLRVLTRWHALVGLPSSLSIIDQEQSDALIEATIKELKFKVTPTAVRTAIETAMKCGTLSDYTASRLPSALSKEQLAMFQYYRKLRTNGMLDFDAMLDFGLSCLEKIPAGEWPYSYLFVDEYQDSSRMDARIYRAMQCKHRFFVGDGDQAVYSFRGGYVHNLLAMAEMSDVQLVVMEENYRSADVICNAAQRLIECNELRIKKRTRPMRGEPGSVEVYELPGSTHELVFIRNLLVERRLEDETAILWRTNALVNNCAEYLEACGLKVARKKWRGEPDDWQEARLLLSLLLNPYNDVVAHQYLAMKYGREQADEIRNAALRGMKCINDQALQLPILRDHACTWAGLAKLLTAQDVSQESFIRLNEARQRLEALGQPWTVADLLFEAVSGSVHEEELGTGSGITVTTFHSSKGREWANVIIGGAEQACTPGKRKNLDVSEERRLFYVAMTRAKCRLFVTYTRERENPYYKGGAPIVSEPSQFIEEFGGGCIEPKRIQMETTSK